MINTYITKDSVMENIINDYNNRLNRYIGVIEKSLSDYFISVSELFKDYYNLVNKLVSPEGYTMDDIIQGELIILNTKLCFSKLEKELNRNFIPDFLICIVVHNTTTKIVETVEENEQFLLHKGQIIQKDLGIRKLRRYGYDILGWYQKK